MKTLTSFVSMLKDRSGATVIEYCIIAGIISVAIVLGATGIGSATNDSFVAAQAGFAP